MRLQAVLLCLFRRVAGLTLAGGRVSRREFSRLITLSSWFRKIDPLITTMVHFASIGDNTDIRINRSTDCLSSIPHRAYLTSWRDSCESGMLSTTAFRQWRSWLRGADLNHRPLGYEEKNGIARRQVNARLD